MLFLPKTGDKAYLLGVQVPQVCNSIQQCFLHLFVWQYTIPGPSLHQLKPLTHQNGMCIDSHWNHFISLRAAADPLAMLFESLSTQTGSICGFSDLVTLAFGSVLRSVNDTSAECASICFTAYLWCFRFHTFLGDVAGMYDIIERNSL